MPLKIEAQAGLERRGETPEARDGAYTRGLHVLEDHEGDGVVVGGLGDIVGRLGLHCDC